MTNHATFDTQVELVFAVVFMQVMVPKYFLWLILIL